MESLAVYEILVKQHERMLFAYILGMVSDKGLAQDVVQEAFVRAYQQLDSLRDKSAFPAWLRSIARNLAIDRLRHAAPEQVVDPEMLEGMEDVFGKFDDPSLGDVWQDRLDLLLKCFESLSDSLKAVMRAFYWEEQQTQAIADRMSINLATVLKRLERGRSEVRNCMQIKAGMQEVK